MNQLLDNILDAISLPCVNGKDHEKSWIIAKQNNSCVFPPPPLKSTWKQSDITPTSIEFAFCTVPLLTEIAAIFASSNRLGIKKKVLALVTNAVRDRGERKIFEMLRSCALNYKRHFEEKTHEAHPEDLGIFQAYLTSIVACYLALCIVASSKKEVPGLFLTMVETDLVPVHIPEFPDLEKSEDWNRFFKAWQTISIVWILLCETKEPMIAFSATQIFENGRIHVLFNDIVLTASPFFVHKTDVAVVNMSKLQILLENAASQIPPVVKDIREEISLNLPKTVPTMDGRREIREKGRYTLWGGITDIEWRERNLEGITVISSESAGVPLFAGINCRLRNTFTRKPNPEFIPMTIWFSVPPPEEDLIWEIAEKNIPDLLRVFVESIRICVVPSSADDKNIRRIPEGYTHSSSQANIGDVSIRYMPRLIRENRDHSGTSSEISHIHPHKVAGHIRRIPLDYQARKNAKEYALEAGIQLPEKGFTFVRPHRRGEDENDTDITKIRTRKTRDNPD